LEKLHNEEFHNMRKPPGGEIKEKEMDKSCSTHKAHEKYNLA